MCFCPLIPGSGLNKSNTGVGAAYRQPRGAAVGVNRVLSQAIRSQNMITRATNRKRRDRNCSSTYWGVPGTAGGGRPSFMLNAVANIPNGNAPIPKDI